MHDLTDDDRARLGGIATAIDILIRSGDVHPDFGERDVRFLRKLAQQTSVREALGQIKSLLAPFKPLEIVEPGNERTPWVISDETVIAVIGAYFVASRALGGPPIEIPEGLTPEEIQSLQRAAERYVESIDTDDIPTVPARFTDSTHDKQED